MSPCLEMSKIWTGPAGERVGTNWGGGGEVAKGLIFIANCRRKQFGTYRRCTVKQTNTTDTELLNIDFIRILDDSCSYNLL